MEAYLSLAEKLHNEASIENAMAQRITKNIKMRTMYLPEADWENRIGFFNEGTIVTIISHGPGNEYLEGLASAISKKNKTQIQLHCEAISARTHKDAERQPGAEAFDGMPVIVDVLYGNAWLAKHVLLGTETQLAVTVSVWSGGKLDDNNFRSHSYSLKKVKTADTEVLTVLIPPRLSKIEKAVLEAVPADISEIHVQGPSVSWSAAGLALKWTAEKKDINNVSQLIDLQQFFVPGLCDVQDVTTVHQKQQQQADTKQQQQQQQINQKGTQQIQQQQQAQQQNDNQKQQQQQVQQQQAQTEQNQDQNQQQQQDTKQQQQDQNDQHDAATGAQHQGAFRDDLDGGFVVLPVDEERYEGLLSRIDFESLDATQSVKELLRLREKLIAVGLG